MEVEVIDLKDVTSDSVPPGSIVITTVELQEPLLTGITNDLMQQIKLLSENAAILLWVTGGGLFKAQRPEFALVLGLARSIMLERPSLKMPVLDVDRYSERPVTTSNNILKVLRQTMHSRKPDLEFRQHDGVLYSSRFVPAASLNKRFRQVQDGETVQTSVTGADTYKLAIKHVGKLESLYFVKHDPVEVQPGYLQVKVKSVGLNAKVRILHLCFWQGSDCIGLLRSKRQDQHCSLHVCT